MPSSVQTSIIIPVFNEQASIINCIATVKETCTGNYEIIVVDGGPYGSTINVIKDSTVNKIQSSPGRAVQMNAGAKAASGQNLIFLHADTTLPPNADLLITEALKIPACYAGAFKLSFDDNSFIMKLIAAIADLRTRIERVPYGDQAIFISKNAFNELGGFPEIPLMEDVEFFRKIKKDRREIIILENEIVTSARRHKNYGPLRCALRNCCLRILHLCGISTETLAGLYRDQKK